MKKTAILLSILFISLFSVTRLSAQEPANEISNPWEFENLVSTFYVWSTRNNPIDNAGVIYLFIPPANSGFISSYEEQAFLYQHGGIDSLIGFNDPNGTSYLFSDIFDTENYPTGWVAVPVPAEATSFNIIIATAITSYQLAPNFTMYLNTNALAYSQDNILEVVANFNPQQYFKEGEEYGASRVSVASVSTDNVLGRFNILLSNGRTFPREDGYESVYDYGHAIGYDMGQQDGLGFGWLRAFFGLFQVIFDIELLPNIKIGYIVGIPIVYGVFKFILGFVRG